MKLKRVDISGNAPILITDASDADTWTSGGSWNANGVILFGAPQGMYRVNSSGGTPELIAPVKSGETGYGAPQFLPDGDRFLMHVRSENPDQVGLYVSSLSHPEEKTTHITSSCGRFVMVGIRPAPAGAIAVARS